MFDEWSDILMRDFLLMNSSLKLSSCSASAVYLVTGKVPKGTGARQGCFHHDSLLNIATVISFSRHKHFCHMLINTVIPGSISSYGIRVGLILNSSRAASHLILDSNLMTKSSRYHSVQVPASRHINS